MVGIEIEAEGLGRAEMIIEAARAAMDAAGNKIRGVDLHAKTRVDTGDDSNVEIANKLIKSARDFFSLGGGFVGNVGADSIAESFANELQRMLDYFAKLPADTMTKDFKVPGKAITTNRATQAVAKGYKEAMARYMEIVGERIDSQVTVTGSAPAPLSPGYAAMKQKKFGFTTPIGVATGQLRENFDPSNSGNIRLHRGVLA